MLIQELSPSMAPQVSSWMAGQPHLGLSMHSQDAFPIGGMGLLRATEGVSGMSQVSCLMWTKFGSTFSTIEEGRPCWAKGHSVTMVRSKHGSAQGMPSSAKALGSSPHSGILGTSPQCFQVHVLHLSARSGELLPFLVMVKRK